jgi:cytochrome c553
MRAQIGRLVLLSGALLAAPALGSAQDAPPALPDARAIPGITAEDHYPNACVSCHVVLPDGRDVRLSTLVAQWATEVRPELLELAQSAAPEGLTLSGTHPNVGAMVREIPSGCLACHAKTSTMAPPFAMLLHRIHLTQAPQSVFLTVYQGECTYCHKLDMTTGAWSIPSAPEPEP